jgi:phosphatidylglycerophosphate synthase
MLDEVLRPVKETVLGAIVHLVPQWMSPNFITSVSGVFGLMCSVFCYLHYFKVGLACWLMNRLLDGIDGVVARARGQKSDFGGLWDLYIDFIGIKLTKKVTVQFQLVLLLLVLHWGNQ